MKAILRFDLDDHNDKMSHKRCIESLDMAIALWKINTWIIEYNSGEISLEIFHREVSEILSNINLNELIE